jgi:DNA-directed RNA polymerase specialized sigma24 family protein
MEAQIQILEQMIFDQKLAVLYRCIDKLPDQNRHLVLELLNHGKIQSLSEKWGLSVACLKSRYHTARKQIQSIMTAIDSFSHFLAS